MITLRTEPGQKVIELGGGSQPLVRPNTDVRMCHDAQGNPTVDFTTDFNVVPYAISSDEFDAVFSRFVIEHLSWRNLGGFISECYRILKPGGKAVIITANTEAQLEWIKDRGFEKPSHKEKSNKKDEFEECSCLLFGDQDYPENTHRNYLSPNIATDLFSQAGFESITIRPYGDLETDMLLEATKPTKSIDQARQEVFDKVIVPTVEVPKSDSPMSDSERVSYFGREYFNGKVYQPFYWDFPAHLPTANYIKSRGAKSTLELGSSRGYVTKRLQDMGLVACGMDVSRHAWLTRVCQGILQWDVVSVPWPYKTMEFSLCFSVDFLDRVPEESLPAVIKEMDRVSQRCIHGIDLTATFGGSDKGRYTIKPKEWWENLFTNYSGDFEIVHKDVMERMIDFPQEVLKGDGKTKLNIGSALTMFHHGWTNIDVLDHLVPFAQGNGYIYKKCDVREGLPYSTTTVDLIFAHHVLEHFTYREGLAFLRECRRVIKLGGVVRIVVPDAFVLSQGFASGDETLFHDLGEINETASALPTLASRVWSVLNDQHQAIYDDATLLDLCKNSGFTMKRQGFRESISPQILRETTESLSSISAYYDLAPG